MASGQVYQEAVAFIPGAPWTYVWSCQEHQPLGGEKVLEGPNWTLAIPGVVSLARVLYGLPALCHTYNSSTVWIGVHGY